MNPMMQKVRFDSAARAEVYSALAELSRTRPLPEAISSLRQRYEASSDFRADILRKWESSGEPMFQRVKGWVPAAERAILSEVDARSSPGPALEEAATMARVSGNITREMMIGSLVPFSLLAACAAGLCFLGG